MNVSETQLDSFKKIKAHMPSIKAKIRGLVAEYHEPLSREEIAKLGGFRLATVCSAVNHLVKEGQLEPVGVMWNAETNRHVQIVQVAA